MNASDDFTDSREDLHDDEFPFTNNQGSMVKDKPYDEEHEVTDESVGTEGESLEESTSPPRPAARLENRRSESKGIEDSFDSTAHRKDFDNSDEESVSDEEDEDEGEEDGEARPARVSQVKLYNPNDYQHLQVSAEIQGLFDYIGRHKPADIELETRLKPFIPDFIPAVGDIDPFLKVPRPDGVPDLAGLAYLDEPAAQQSDPTVLEILLKSLSKQTVKSVTVRSIERADQNPARITKWIQNMDEVHRKKPPTQVTYGKPMPDIEQLMQVWPAEFEQLLKTTPLPSADMNLSLESYVRVVCALLDIPVHEGKITDSLHVLFTLFSEFKTNSHFQQQSLQ